MAGYCICQHEKYLGDGTEEMWTLRRNANGQVVNDLLMSDQVKKKTDGYMGCSGAAGGPSIKALESGHSDNTTVQQSGIGKYTRMEAECFLQTKTQDAKRRGSDVRPLVLETRDDPALESA